MLFQKLLLVRRLLGWAGTNRVDIWLIRMRLLRIPVMRLNSTCCVKLGIWRVFRILKISCKILRAHPRSLRSQGSFFEVLCGRHGLTDFILYGHFLWLLNIDHGLLHSIREAHAIIGHYDLRRLKGGYIIWLNSWGWDHPDLIWQVHFPQIKLCSWLMRLNSPSFDANGVKIILFNLIMNLHIASDVKIVNFCHLL